MGMKEEACDPVSGRPRASARSTEHRRFPDALLAAHRAARTVCRSRTAERASINTGLGLGLAITADCIQLSP